MHCCGRARAEACAMEGGFQFALDDVNDDLGLGGGMNMGVGGMTFGGNDQYGSDPYGADPYGADPYANIDMSSAKLSSSRKKDKKKKKKKSSSRGSSSRERYRSARDEPSDGMSLAERLLAKNKAGSSSRRSSRPKAEYVVWACGCAHACS